MKLKNEVDFIIKEFEKFGIDKIKTYSIELKSLNNYKNFNTRLSFEVLNIVDKNNYVNNLYSTYNCNDAHIKTLMLYVLKKIDIIK